MAGDGFVLCVGLLVAVEVLHSCEQLLRKMLRNELVDKVVVSFFLHVVNNLHQILNLR